MWRKALISRREWGVETIPRALIPAATPAMTNDIHLIFSLPAVSCKKVTAAFDGGRLSSDGGVMLLALAERRRKVAETLAAHIADPRDPLHITHTVADVLRARMLAIGCGYPDGNDFDWLRRDPAFKLACGRLPDTRKDLCSQPTISRWENAPTLREIIRLTYTLVDIWCRSYAKPPKSVVLDIDDTVDVVHGHQQLAQWNAHYDERCFLPIHVYDTATGRPVVVILRPGKTPSGKEVRKLLSRLIGRIRRHWPDTRITIRGDGHYGREEAMTWCENNVVDYIFGLPGNVVLDRLVEPAADDIQVRRAESQAEVFRGFTATRYAAKSWDKERRVVARIRSRRAPAMRMTCCAEALVSATSSLRCRAAMLSIFMKRSTAPVGRPRTSSSNTRRNWRPIAPVADRHSPTRCGLSCTPVPTGCCSTCALRSRVGIRCGRPSSPPSVCVC